MCALLSKYSAKSEITLANRRVKGTYGRKTAKTIDTELIQLSPQEIISVEPHDMPLIDSISSIMIYSRHFALNVVG